MPESGNDDNDGGSDSNEPHSKTPAALPGRERDGRLSLVSLC
jgi:hypothetical protein